MSVQSDFFEFLNSLKQVGVISAQGISETSDLGFIAEAVSFSKESLERQEYERMNPSVLLASKFRNSTEVEKAMILDLMEEDLNELYQTTLRKLIDGI